MTYPGNRQTSSLRPTIAYLLPDNTGDEYLFGWFTQRSVAVIREPTNPRYKSR